MPLALLPVTSPSEVPTLSRLHLDAFMLVRVNQALYPKGLTPPIIASTESRHQKYMTSDPTAQYFKIIDSDLDDKTIAFAEWHVFSTPEEEGRRLDLGPRTWAEDVNLELADQFWGNIVNGRKRMEGKAHVFLSIIATDPSQGRRGAASMLMEWGVREADRRHLPCFLDSTPLGRGLYAKFGFEEVGTFELDVGKDKEGAREMYRHFVMVRPAKETEKS